jgi:hypothetical protein
MISAMSVPSTQTLPRNTGKSSFGVEPRCAHRHVASLPVIDCTSLTHRVGHD